VRDTSVAARFLDEPATGLASLVARHLGVTLGKGLQGHDWAHRPLSGDELAYLGGDVLHLLDLDEVLEREVARLGIAEEVELECRYKLACALAPPKETRPAYARIKGQDGLDEVGRAVLWQLAELRERIARQSDRPPFRVAPSDLLVTLARRKPASRDELRRLRARHELLRHEAEILGAVRAGIEAAVPPLEPREAALPRAEVALRKRLERGLSRWRQAEARSRTVSPQVVLPGHCLSELVALLTGATPALAPADLAGIPGLGQARVDRHGQSWLALAAAARERTEP
jgi:ribonuclease D